VITGLLSTPTEKHIGHFNMTWFLFNEDNSYCCSSEERFPDDWMAKTSATRQVELVGDQIGQHNSDEFTLLTYNPETNTAFIPQDTFLIGSARHKERLHHFFSIYSHLEKEDRPQDFEEVEKYARELLGDDVVNQYFEDNILTEAEQQAMLELLEAD